MAPEAISRHDAHEPVATVILTKEMPTMFARFAGLIAPLVILLSFAPQSAAQDLTGRVVDALSGAPVVGGIVRANGPAGELVGGTLTNGGGAFILRVPAGSQVGSLTVERIGYASQTFPAEVFGGPLGIDLRVASNPVALAGIVVTAQSYCRATPSDGGSVQTLWDEARKSLEITTLSTSQRLLRFETESYQRDLDATSYEVLQGSSSRHTVTSDSPYRAISVEQMTERGWVAGNLSTGMDLFAPDAAILLTDAFADQHCFTAERTRDAILLHFTPNEQRESFPEISGTLVLHPETSELVELRFRYVGVPDLGRGGHAGGEIAFLAAPNGIRVVRRWAIRAPVLSLVRRGPGSSVQDLTVEYVHEDGGRILSVISDDMAFQVPTQALDLGETRAGRDPNRSSLGLVASSRLMSGGAVAELLVRNDDARPFRVTRLELRNCINTALRCDDYPVDVTIGPGETRVLFRLRKEIALDPFHYEWNYFGESLEAEETVEPPPTVQREVPRPESTVPAVATARVRSIDAVTAADLAGERFDNALDVIRRVRPQWLNTRSADPFRTANGPPPPQIRVYVDNINMTPALWEGPENALRAVPADIIAVMEWVDGPSATIRWGTNHQLGAIEITTRR